MIEWSAKERCVKEIVGSVKLSGRTAVVRVWYDGDGGLWSFRVYTGEREMFESLRYGRQEETCEHAEFVATWMLLQQKKRWEAPDGH